MANSQSSSPSNPLIALLTTRDHCTRSWVTSLADSLAANAQVQVVCVEEWSEPFTLPWALAVNRVSDAAAPRVAKATLSLLHCCELQGIPTINGAAAYSRAMSKVCQHAVFHAAGCATPPTVVLRQHNPPPPDQLASLVNSKGLTFPLLLKPNAGGFGDGIQRLEDVDSLASASTSCSNDGTALLQSLLTPESSKIFRAWVLGGRIQCAVSVVSTPAADAPVAAVCMDNVCQLAPQAPSITACQLPPNVEKLVLHAMHVCGADCGSIEFLFPADDPSQAVFFDLNLCSTLPLDTSSVQHAHTIWGESFDPWSELAAYCLSRIL